MKKKYRIKKNTEFQEVFQRGFLGGEQAICYI